MKLVVCSDLHIRNNVRHGEYVRYFDYIFSVLQTISPEYILFCGDLFHSKTTLSPDSYSYAFYFLNMLGKLATKKVFVLAGNHDMNEKNLEKLDAITPLFEHLDHNKIKYMKHSLDYEIDNIVFRAFSLSDKEHWNFEKTSDKLTIGVYHGPLNGVKTDLGFTFSNGRDVSEFEACDYLFCGDIHTLCDYTENGNKISVGNPIQQDFGESLVKGMWEYNITSKTEFTRNFIQIPNFYPFVTLRVGDTLPELKDSVFIRFRIFSDKSHEETSEYVSSLRKKYGSKITSLSVSRTPIDSLETTISKVLTYEEYVKNHKNKDALLDLYNIYIKQIEDASNVNNWKIKDITWNNLLSYGEDNGIDFSKYKDNAVGIFGKNYSGKTSIIDILCFALYGSWTKDFVKLIHLINTKKDYADVRINLQINGKDFSIYRKLERAGKNCKSSLVFRNETDNETLNADDITATQRSIEKYIGTKTQFLLTSLSTQFNNFSLLVEKNTKRKEYFSSFLGITKYEQMCKNAKDDIKVLKDEIALHTKFSNLDSISKKMQDLDIEISETKKEIQKLEDKALVLSTIDKAYYKIILQNKELRNNAKFVLQQCDLKLEKNNKKIDELAKELVPDVYCPQIIHRDEVYEDPKDLYNLVDKISAQIMEKNFDLDKYKDATKLLESVPCGTQFLQCRFIVKSKSHLEVDVNALNEEISKMQTQVKDIKDNIQRIEEKNRLIRKNVEKNKEFEKLQQKSLFIQTRIKELTKEREEEVEEYGKLHAELRKLEDIVAQDLVKEKEIENAIKEELEIHKLQIAFQGSLKVSEIHKKELQETLAKIEEKQISLAYLEDFAESVGKNGIIVSILNQYIPAISDFVNDILSNFVEFTIKIDIENEKDIEIYIVDAFSTRLIETCSGSQLTIVAYALRMALLHYCQIPSCDLVVMDEPATSLDSDHLSDFSKLLDMIKLNNKTIITVTHIMMLKDFMDVSLVVDKSSGYSKIIS